MLAIFIGFIVVLAVTILGLMINGEVEKLTFEEITSRMLKVMAAELAIYLLLTLLYKTTVL